MLHPDLPLQSPLYILQHTVPYSPYFCSRELIHLVIPADMLKARSKSGAVPDFDQRNSAISGFSPNPNPPRGMADIRYDFWAHCVRDIVSLVLKTVPVKCLILQGC